MRDFEPDLRTLAHYEDEGHILAQASFGAREEESEGLGEAEIVASIQVTGLTGSRLIATDANSVLASVGNLTSWVSGTSNQITVGDDGDGTITISLPSAITTPGTLTVTGHLTPQADNTYDNGSSGAAWRDIRAGRQFLGAAGSPSSPGWSFSGDPNSGYYGFGNDDIALSLGAVAMFYHNATAFSLKSSTLFGWSSGDPTAAGQDTILKRLAAGFIQQENGSAFQEFRVGGTSAQGVVMAYGVNSGNKCPVFSLFNGGNAESFIGGGTSIVGGGILFGITGGLADYADATLLANYDWKIDGSTRSWVPRVHNTCDVGASSGPQMARNVYAAGTVFGYGANDSISFLVGASTAFRSAGGAGATTYIDLGTVHFRGGDGSVAAGSILVYTTIQAGAQFAEAGVVSGTISAFGSGAASIVWRETGSNVEGFCYADTTQVIIGSSTNHPLVFRVSNTDRMSITGTNTVTIANGAVGQLLNVYGHVANGNFTTVSNDGTSGYVYSTGSGSSLYLGAAGSAFVQISNGGHGLAVFDNANDWGGASNRFRTGYFGTSVIVGAAETTVTGEGRLNIYAAGGGAYALFRDTTNNIEGFCGVSTGASALVFGSATGHATVIYTNNTQVMHFSADSTTVTLGDGVNFAYNTATGTKHGTATTQKQSWWNAAPVAQPAHIADADGTLADATRAINAILAWQATTGLTAAA